MLPNAQVQSTQYCTCTAAYAITPNDEQNIVYTYIYLVLMVAPSNSQIDTKIGQVLPTA